MHRCNSAMWMSPEAVEAATLPRHVPRTLRSPEAEVKLRDWPAEPTTASPLAVLMAMASALPEVVHSHGMKTHVLGSLLGRQVPVVWHLHDYIGMRPASSRLLRLLSRRCALAIAVFAGMARLHGAAFGAAFGARLRAGCAA